METDEHWGWRWADQCGPPITDDRVDTTESAVDTARVFTSDRSLFNGAGIGWLNCPLNYPRPPKVKNLRTKSDVGWSSSWA